MQESEVTKSLSKHTGLPLWFQAAGCKHLVGGEVAEVQKVMLIAAGGSPQPPPLNVSPVVLSGNNNIIL